MKAGDYAERLAWLKQSTSRNINDGQKKEAFAANGYLWASLEVSQGQRQDEFGGMQTSQRATVRLRNYPDVSALDRLTDSDGQVWQIESLYYGDNETICDCSAFDDLELNG